MENEELEKKLNERLDQLDSQLDDILIFVRSNSIPSDDACEKKLNQRLSHIEFLIENLDQRVHSMITSPQAKHETSEDKFERRLANAERR